MDILIDGSSDVTAANKKWRGAGMVSGNNSSRLLLDYKTEHPGSYNEILELIFGRDGIGVTHLKLEMGSDVNSTSGTEPAVKRSEKEPADVTRGAGFQLAADAKNVNPDLTLDMLFWSEPRWVSDSADVYSARYKWYKETLIAAYETYGLCFDYVSVSQNEREIDCEWIKYFARKLRSEKDSPYDFGSIKIVAADEENSWRIADMMLADSELRDSVDVIGSHYTSHSTDNARLLSDKYGKELWFSEGCPPMSYSKGTYRFDDSGLSGINGVLDVADRIAAMYPCGGMTMYEYQPVVSSYYDGVTFCQKQLINACEPWSGAYQLESGFYMSLHFSQFFRKGWTFADSACFCDGVKGGDGHALVNTTYCCMTAFSSVTGDYSTVIVNSSPKELTYRFSVKNLKKACENVDVWETRGPDMGSYDENYFRKICSIVPTEEEGKYTFTVNVKSYSMITVSTVRIERKEYADRSSKLLPLPYTDDFSYGEYPEDYLCARGAAPRYMTDEGGAFEVTDDSGKNVIMQQITQKTKAEEWGWTPDPVTNFGDDRWNNYSISADIKLCRSMTPTENYAGVGLRYILGTKGMSGYGFMLHEDGSWRLTSNDEILAHGKISSFRADSWVNIRLSAEFSKVRAYINGVPTAKYSGEGKAYFSAGRAALYSSYNKNSFAGIKVKPLGETPYAERFDDTDESFEYSGNWEHNLMSSYSNYRRTISTGTAGASVILEFTGRGFGLFGENKEHCSISATLDGNLTVNKVKLPVSSSREIFFSMNELSNERHTAVITVNEGSLSIDGAEIIR